MPQLVWRRLRTLAISDPLICLPFATDGKPILNLPKRTVEVVSCFFDPAEREFYDAFEKKQELTFNKVR